METLTTPATLESLEAIGRYVLEAARRAGLERKATYRLRLAVDEIATNIITHGYPEAGRPGDVVVRSELGEAALTITLEDTADPFDPLSQVRPEQIDLPLEERPIGGLGVFLAVEGVDEFRYEYVNKRNCNIFTMRRQTA
jgi:anti-sigma regulatory factor (Ser/Thr protein kinase)